jgi:putative intracellular protease/amidase
MSLPKRLLVVTTSNSRFEGPNPHQTGVWLSEFAEPYMEFHKSGVELVVASPLGGRMPVDPRSAATPEREKEWKPAMEAAASTVKLSDVSSRGFDAIFLPGGHGPMFDLPGNSELARLLEAFHAEGKIISAVCHGPAGLVGAKRQNGEPLIKGVTLTFYTYEEEVAANLDKEVPFILENRLKELGANFVARGNKADHVDQFITGQNPNSSTSVARSVLAALEKQFQPLLNVVGTELASARIVAEFPVKTFIENIGVNQRQFMKALKSGRFGQGQAHSLTMVIFG